MVKKIVLACLKRVGLAVMNRHLKIPKRVGGEGEGHGEGEEEGGF
jgi:hypothetical protein